MHDSVYRILLDLTMASDPSPLSDEDDEYLREWLSEIAREKGHDGWVVAYHEFDPDGGDSGR